MFWNVKDRLILNLKNECKVMIIGIDDYKNAYKLISGN